jgi:hypothetical protein
MKQSPPTPVSLNFEPGQADEQLQQSHAGIITLFFLDIACKIRNISRNIYSFM